MRNRWITWKRAISQGERPAEGSRNLTRKVVGATHCAMLAEVGVIYRESKKQRDNFWTEWCSRPPAAVVVFALKGTPITPNQVTFLSLAVFAGAAASLIALRGQAGLIAAALIVQASYILDCVDGQLARYKQLTSPVGALLDFLMDEMKAFLLVGAASVRLWLQSGDLRWLLLGVGGLAAVASGIALTTFMRRDEYLAATGARPAATAAAPNGRRGVIGAVEWVGKFVLHYPSHLWLFAVLDRLDIFLLAYLAAHGLYLGRASLTVLMKLGRPVRATEERRAA